MSSALAYHSHCEYTLYFYAGVKELTQTSSSLHQAQCTQLPVISHSPTHLEPKQIKVGKEIHLHSQHVPGLPHALPRLPPASTDGIDQVAELWASGPASPSTEAHDVLDGFSSPGHH